MSSGNEAQSLPMITVIICARNAAGHLPRSIGAVQAQDYPPDKLKLLVLDNASSDDTAKVAERLGARVEHHAVPGIAGARDVAWRLTDTELVAYLDSDCEPPIDWLRRALIHLYADESVGAVGVRLIDAPPQSVAEIHIACQHMLSTDEFQNRRPLRFPFLVTAGLLLRRSALEAVNGFDRSFGFATGEDADLCWRLERAGWKCVYAREIEIIHHHRSTIRSMMRQVHWYGLGTAATFAKWHRELGYSWHLDPKPYMRLLRALCTIPFDLIFRRDPYRRMSGILRLLDSVAYLSGKWRGAWYHRKLVL